MMKQEFKNMRKLWDTFKHSNIQLVGVSEGKEEEKEIENLFEKNNEGELPQSAERNRLTGSPGSSESQRSWT